MAEIALARQGAVPGATAGGTLPHYYASTPGLTATQQEAHAASAIGIVPSNYAATVAGMAAGIAPSTYAAAPLAVIANSGATVAGMQPVGGAALQDAQILRGMQRFSVDHEDCDFHAVVSSSAGVALPIGHRSRAAQQRGAGNVRNVYVQDVKNAAQFRAITPERARHSYGIAQHADSQARNRAGKKRPMGANSSSAHKVLSVAALRATVIDPGAFLLGTSAVDEEIFALVVLGESCKLYAAMLFFACQGLLAGLSLLNAALVVASRPGPTSGASITPATTLSEQEYSQGAANLAQTLSVIEPYLTGFTTTCAEIALVGSVLRVFHARERANANGAGDGTDQLGEQPLTGDIHELTARREALAQVSFCTVASVANFAVVVCCLLGFGNSATLLFHGPDGGDGSKWHATAARVLFGLRAGFGLFAVLPMLLDAQYLVSPTLPELALASPDADLALAAEEAKIAEQPSAIA